MTSSGKIFNLFGILLLIVFLPVLFCVIFIGNAMDYNAGLKLVTRLPNQVLFLIALAGLCILAYLFWKLRGLRLTTLGNRITNGVLFAAFLGLFFLNVEVAKEIAFYLPWDIGVVTSVASGIAQGQPVGYLYYLSIYSNNIPITYILFKLFHKAMEMQNYPYVYDFIGIQANCLLISAAGFFCCLTVKKLTRGLLPTAAAFLIYLVLVGISPWKIAPYTDTFGLVFPILCLYFYISYRKAEHWWSKYLYLILAFLAGMTGGFIKPNLYIVVIALIMAEAVFFLFDRKKNLKFILAEIVLLAALLLGSRQYQEKIIEEIGFEFNPEIEADWRYYFYMGLNEEKTGSYNGDDATIFGEFQTSKSDRMHAELERAGERLRERGFWGSIYFYLRKLVMTFNDGLFGWRTEVWIGEEYPEDMAKNTAFTQWLRNLFWPNGMDFDVKGYNTFCQLVWIFSILCIPGICLGRGREKEEHGILILCFLGIFFYQMLFEARSRYLFAFLPVLIAAAVCGMGQYIDCMTRFVQKKKETKVGDADKHYNQKHCGAGHTMTMPPISS